jgi:hypothetical protein
MNPKLPKIGLIILIIITQQLTMVTKEKGFNLIKKIGF